MTEQNQILEYPKGVKWTKQRKCVYQVLSEAAEPLSAQQIYMQVEEMTQNAAYALSTIYRILAAFEEKDLVSSTTWMGDDTVVYELNRGGHTHYAVCLGCHKRIPLHSCPFTVGHFGHRHSEQGGEELADFTVIGHKIELYGYCSECGKNRGES
jgi:Fur family ferric uptake transcriptional regulator